MNYIRGAVSAISAPYQYYKDLPPINASTLTGAIDVIVIQRPTDNGDTELACSPFHVRFGKWQVLRPGEKKVNVSVNGHPIPFDMKIGDAGEAFFVFETDGDVPADLITSPLLQPTRPEEARPEDENITVDSSNAEHDLGGKYRQDINQGSPVDARNQMQLRQDEQDTHEPEFLDLNALPSAADSEDGKNMNETPKQTFSHPSFIQRPSHIVVDEPARTLPSPPPTPIHAPSTYMPEMPTQDLHVDEVLECVPKNLRVPEVDYHEDIAIDGEGYHSHNRERSDRTVTPLYNYTLPSGTKSRSTTPSPIRGFGLPRAPFKNAHRSTNTETSISLHPSFRAASEPPQDTDDYPQQVTAPPSKQNSSSSSSKLTVATPMQEYSWDWGAFPQPSPIQASFSKGGRFDGRSWGKGKEKVSKHLSRMTTFERDGSEEPKTEHGRSQSVPPELEGSPKRDRGSRELVEDDETEVDDSDDEDEDEDRERYKDDAFLGFGKGGRLCASQTDPTKFILQIEGRNFEFELSLVKPNAGEDRLDSAPGVAIYSRNAGGQNKIFHSLDEVEAARVFSQGKFDFQRFLEEEGLVNSPELVIRWANNQYIMRDDGSPLIGALAAWRDTALQQKATNPSSPPASPPPVDETLPSPLSPIEDQPQDKYHHRSKSEPPEKPPGKPTSWVQWWSRGRRKNIRTSNEVKSENTHDVGINTEKGTRPNLRGMASAPSSNSNSTLSQDNAKNVPSVGSAPAYPSTPIRLVKDLPPMPVPEGSVKTRKYAKTLRLTSDQLKSLNLKSGPNTITFSLSTSGVVACTARIFVWDSSDFIVVSDIDGTITKSDGLGHVFAMIGRDWTHLGVAKLYTDIARNGYKIMYLTSRAIGQADATRYYLKGIKQNDYQLPEGPVIMSPDRLMASLHREVIMRKPEVFKMACLRDIQRLFGEASRNPFYAGFGNRITDALSYRSVNVPSARIFTIDSSGEVKMELLELAGYKSSYIHMTDLVDQMFPPIHRKWAPEFTDFNYWKTPVQDFPLPDFSPPSPTLSARSDTSQGTLARLRNFSLVGNRQGTSRTSSSLADGPDNERKSSRLQQMSSFEKLSNTLGFTQTSSMTDGIRRSASPGAYSSTSYDSDDDVEDGGTDERRHRERRRSMTSMPGTLDERQFDTDEDEPDYEGSSDEGDEANEYIEDGDTGGDEAFDEDLLAAGEMKNVPFL